MSAQPDLPAIARSGVTALNRGDVRAAKAAFERIVASEQADASIYLGLAYACAGLKEEQAALAAVDKALLLEPGNLRALLFKADFLDRAGDAKNASFFYRAVVSGAPPPEQLPSELRNEVKRAEAMCQHYLGQFESFLNEELSRQGLAGQQSARRFLQSLDILFGRKKIYFQEPLNYFFPELPQIQFYERNMLPWLDTVEAAYPDIRAELLEVMQQKLPFAPYVEANPQLPRAGQDGMLNNPDWSAFYLWKGGEIVPENAARCPKTLAALAGLPQVRIANRSPSVLFSQLRPGAHIPPHTGRINARLICHLPLLVPEQCRFRVGNETRDVVAGKAWAFDDTMEHEAWNDSKETRVILIFEVWRPELTAEERGMVSAMFNAIDAHSGEKPAWSI
jgi:aspartyl/asparaginyl beta-hydroxylase (cupin superfamily)